jgi:hypothetical protein
LGQCITSKEREIINPGNAVDAAFPVVERVAWEWGERSRSAWLAGGQVPASRRPASQGASACPRAGSRGGGPSPSDDKRAGADANLLPWAQRETLTHRAAGLATMGCPASKNSQVQVKPPHEASRRLSAAGESRRRPRESVPSCPAGAGKKPVHFPVHYAG